MENSILLAMSFTVVRDKGKDSERKDKFDEFVIFEDGISEAESYLELVEMDPKYMLPSSVEDLIGDDLDSADVELYTWNMSFVVKSSEHYATYNPLFEALSHYLSGLTESNVSDVANALLTSGEDGFSDIMHEAGIEDVSVWEPINAHASGEFHLVEHLCDIVKRFEDFI